MKISLLFLAIIFLPLSCAGLGNETLRQTTDKLEQALLTKDFAIINRHLSLNSIVSAKIKELSVRTQKKKSIISLSIGKISIVSEPVIAKAATAFIMREYSRSSPALRQTYLKQFKIKSIKEKNNSGAIIAVFMKKPAFLSAVKDKNGNWIINGIESVVVDQELGYLFEKMKLKY